ALEVVVVLAHAGARQGDGSSDAPAAKRGRTTLTPAPGGAGSATRTRTIQLLPAVISAAGFAPGSLVVTEGGQARLPRHLFAPGGAHGAIGATTRPGSISLSTRHH